MAQFSISNTRIAGISAALPKRAVSNRDLKGLSAQEIELLITTTGIENRRLADETTCASDLCLAAAEKLLSELNWNKEEIDVLIFVTQTPDFQVPGNSMLLQQKLELPTSCLAFDINQGCAGYVYGLSVISGLMSSSGMKKGLLLVGDTITKIIDKEDNSTTPIFSDAGSATAIEFSNDAKPMHFNLQTDGAKHDAITVEKGGARNPSKEDAYMTMHGHDIFAFGLKEVAPNIHALLEFCHTNKDRIDYFVFHQANRLLNESIRKKVGVDPEKVPTTIAKFGNTSCATIPVTIVSEIAERIKTKESQLVLSGFGVGLSWGSAMVNLDEIVCPELIEM
jgi:3-oxoacyl-[acyl-carrier-protein] synthase-3